MRNKLFLTIGLLLAVVNVHAERIHLLPFGDFEQWAVRYIKESRLLGGQTKTLYAIGPMDTIRTNQAYQYGKRGCIWSVSNAYAKVMGVEKASGSVYPERRGSGWCCRMDSKLESVVALHVIDLKVAVAGTVFAGKTAEPVTKAGADDPYSVLDMGVPYTEKQLPTALMLDYKAQISTSNEVTLAKATARPKTIEGHDEAEFYIYFQYRWEDKDGNVYARRVGTGYERISKTVPVWQNDHRIPIRWGNITTQPNYKSYEGLNQHAFMCRNSRGKMVPIKEVGFGNDHPTHMIIMLTSGKYEAFVAHVGNTVWVDNIRLVYEE